MSSTQSSRGVAAHDTLRAREWERKAHSIYIEVEKVEESQEWPSDLGMMARLMWMEAGRHLERLCERDGISRWNYRWPR